MNRIVCISLLSDCLKKRLVERFLNTVTLEKEESAKAYF